APGELEPRLDRIACGAAWPKDACELEASGRWLERLVAANGAVGYFDDRAVRRRAAIPSDSICAAAAPRRVPSWTVFSRSPLAADHPRPRWLLAACLVGHLRRL